MRGELGAVRNRNMRISRRYASSGNKIAAADRLPSIQDETYPCVRQTGDFLAAIVQQPQKSPLSGCPQAAVLRTRVTPPQRPKRP